LQRVREEKDISGCAIVGMISEDGRRFSGETVIRSIASMRERSNGLGGGFAAYGIYPDFADLYAFHVMCDSARARVAARRYLEETFKVRHQEAIPRHAQSCTDSAPILERYFLEPPEPTTSRGAPCEAEEDIIVRHVMFVNRNIDGAFVFSSGKNMGVFKGVGYPEEIGRFYRLDEYEAHTWLSHGRFPTNTTGWWGGAHPFGLLDWAVVHNGEISSYGINRRYLENNGYFCTLRTDTEVICYLFDLLMRRHRLPLEAAAAVLAPPFWTDIERMPQDEAELARALRIVYAGALLNGPFSVVVAHSGGLIGLNDRTKLRPMTAARSGGMLYLASEESAIRAVCPSPDSLWYPEGGRPVVGRVREPAYA